MRSFHTTNFLVRKPQALPMWTAPIQGFRRFLFVKMSEIINISEKIIGSELYYCKSCPHENQSITTTIEIQPYGSVMWGASFLTGIFIICFIMFIVWLSPVDLLKKGSLSIMVFGSFFDQGIERLSERFRHPE